jgi:hypothetical protein
MGRAWPVLLLLLLLPALASPDAALAAPAAEPDCAFRLGFKTLHDLIPSVVGSCVENETHNPQNGDGLQHTSRGLLVWRKDDNWTAFTDGYRTWLNGPNGLQNRLNTERFAWEGGGGTVAAPAAPRPPQSAGPAAASDLALPASLQPAWKTILGLNRWGPFYREWAPKTGVRVMVGAMPAGVAGGFQPRSNAIMLNSASLDESRFVTAATLAHELFHAMDAAFAPDQLRDCIGEETRAFLTEASVWEEIWGSGPAPNGTASERFENTLLNLVRTQGADGVRRAVAGSSAYQRECGMSAELD